MNTSTTRIVVPTKKTVPLTSQNQKTKTKTTTKKKEEEDIISKFQQISNENNFLKESLISKEIEIKRKEEEIKEIEFEHQLYIEELEKEQENKIKELSTKLALMEQQRNVYAKNLEKMGINPLSLKEIDLKSDENFVLQKQQYQMNRENLVQIIFNKKLKYQNQIQTLNEVNSRFENKENFFQ
jgi:hypothetical protein